MNFYDDFIHLEIGGTAANGQTAREAGLTLMGWAFKTTGSKAAPFAPVFITLGCQVEVA